MNQLVSIIVPIYNIQDYLEKCISSLIGQTYRNIEIILVNDGSTDNSSLICENYKNHERIKIINKNNGGQSSARNSGIDIAKGDYLCFIDGDDWIEPNYIEILYKLIIENNAEISQCSICYDKEGSCSKVNIQNESELITGREAILNLYKKDSYINTVSPCTKLYDRKIFSSLRYPEGMVFEDEAIIHEILYDVKRMVINTSSLYHYVQRSNSTTTSEYNLNRLYAVEAIEKRLKFLEEKKDSELIYLTEPVYFRVLLENAYNLYISKLKNKQLFIAEITNKLDTNLSKFGKNKNMSFINKVLLICYRLDPKVAYAVNGILVKMKNIKNKLRF